MCSSNNGAITNHKVDIGTIPEIEVVSNLSQKEKNVLRKLLNSLGSKHPKGVNYATLFVCFLLGWASLYTIIPGQVQPSGKLFALMSLMVLSSICGWLMSLVHLPPLLGMLICGITLKNVGFFIVSGAGYTDALVILREISFAVILIKAGLGLDAKVLRRLSFTVTKLAITPCVTEALAVAATAYFLAGFPWLWGLLLGFVLSAVSPAVVVPSLLNLKKEGYGENKGISTLVIAASSVDDIIGISCFGSILGIIFSEGDVMTNLIQGPLEAIIGSTFGFGWGFIAACLPHPSEDYLVLKRSFMVGGGGLVATLGSQLVGYSGAGPLATIVLSFVACLCWKWQGWSSEYNPVANVFSQLWIIMQPILFGLIGTEVVFQEINLLLIGQSFAIIGAGLFIRIVTCFLVLIGESLNFKEIIFINFAWLPKATVQAVLGPVALDIARKRGDVVAKSYAQKVLTIAALSILITAPIGAIGIALSGPKLLTKTDTMVKENRENDPQIANEIYVIDERL